MKVLITGIAGFMGSRLAHWIVENVPGAKVYGVDDVDRTPLSSGVDRMWDWTGQAWNRYPERRVSHHVSIEVERGLYSYWR